MWDDDMINKPCAQLPLFGFLPPWNWQCNWREMERKGYCVFVCMYLCVFIHVGTTWTCKCALMVLIYIGLMLRETELKRQCVCVMCSLHQ